MQHQEIIFGQTGQTFQLDPPDGRPDDSPMPVVSTVGTSFPMTTGECRIDPVDTALHGDAYRGTLTIRVTDATGMQVGGRYAMTKPEGDREWIYVAAIDGCTITLRHPLIHRYAGAATIRGARISIDVEPAWVANRECLTEYARGLAGYMLHWTYAVRGIEVTAVTFADLVTVPSSELVTPADVAARNPGWIEGLRPEHRANQGADFIAEAFRAVRLEAVGDRHAQRKIRDSQVLRELVQSRAQVIRLEHEVLHGEPMSSELAVAEGRYRRRYDQLIKPPREDYIPKPPVPTKPQKPQLAKGSEPGVARRIPKLTRF